MNNTTQVDAREVKPSDVIWNQGYAFEVAETFFQDGMNGKEVFRYRVSRCLIDATLPPTYATDAVYGHNSDILVTVVVREPLITRE
jgi:hypothetical protein